MLAPLYKNPLLIGREFSSKMDFKKLRICSENSRETGFEPATSAVTGQCSNQLNYSRICFA